MRLELCAKALILMILQTIAGTFNTHISNGVLLRAKPLILFGTVDIRVPTCSDDESSAPVLCMNRCRSASCMGLSSILAARFSLKALKRAVRARIPESVYALKPRSKSFVPRSRCPVSLHGRRAAPRTDNLHIDLSSTGAHNSTITSFNIKNKWAT